MSKDSKDYAMTWQFPYRWQLNSTLLRNKCHDWRLNRVWLHLQIGRRAKRGAIYNLRLYQTSCWLSLSVGFCWVLIRIQLLRFLSCLFCCVFFVVVVIVVCLEAFQKTMFTMQIEFERRVSATRLWYFCWVMHKTL